MPAERDPQPPDYLLVFDGGSRNNPEFGYGSYLLITPEGPLAPRRLEFGRGVTNNQAEYMALVAGLRELPAILEASGRQQGEVALEVRGDSSLVINQLLGRWRVRHPGLRPLYEEARRLLSGFRWVRLVWTPRARSVELLGH